MSSKITDGSDSKHLPHIPFDSEMVGGLGDGGGGDEGRLNLQDKTGHVKVHAVAKVEGGRLRVNGAIEKERRLLFEGETAKLTLGGNGQGGKMTLEPRTATFTSFSQKQSTIEMDGEDGTIILRGKNQETVRIEGDEGNIYLGGNDTDGDLLLFSSHSATRTIGSSIVRISGSNATIQAGGKGDEGKLILKSDEGQRRVLLSGDKGRACLGGKGGDGDVSVFSSHGDHANPEDAIIRLDGLLATIIAGGDGGDVDQSGRTGSLQLRNGKGQPRIRLEGVSGTVAVGGHDRGGNVLVFPSTGNNVAEEQATVQLRGEKGTVIVQNSSFCVEVEFEDVTGVVPGAVVGIGPTGGFRACRDGDAVGDDAKVVGVVVDPGEAGMILGRKANRQNSTFAIAMLGRALCRVDTELNGCNVGDVLTTSSTLGQARARGGGSFIGIALAPAPHGIGSSLIPVFLFR